MILTALSQILTTTATDKLDSTITASFSEGKNFIPVPDSSFICDSDYFPFSNATKQIVCLIFVIN